MLYMIGDVTIIVLESANLDELKKGRPAKTSVVRGLHAAFSMVPESSGVVLRQRR
jgi:hypothetical protein